MKILKKVIAIVLIISVTLALLINKTYIRKSCEVTGIKIFTPTSIEELEFYETVYRYYDGELLLVYKDKNNEYYCWSSNVYAESENEKHDELRKERYILLKHNNDVIGIFQIK